MEDCSIPTSPLPRLLPVRAVTSVLGNKSDKSTYDQVASKVFPEAMIVRLGSRIRFREDLLRVWLAGA